MHNFCENPALKNTKKFRFNAQFAEKTKVYVDFDHSLLLENNFLSANFTHFQSRPTQGRKLKEITAKSRNVVHRGVPALFTKIFGKVPFLCTFFVEIGF